MQQGRAALNGHITNTRCLSSRTFNPSHRRIRVRRFLSSSSSLAVLLTDALGVLIQTYSGGMELLFCHQHSHRIQIPRFYDPPSIAPTSSNSPAPPTAPAPLKGKQTDIRYLIWWLREYLLDDKNRPELFSQGETM